MFHRATLAFSFLVCPQVSITKGDFPSETSVAIFFFDADDKAVRYFEEINRKCSLYCFDIDEAIVGVTKEEFNRGMYEVVTHVRIAQTMLFWAQWRLK